jgi:hypothetical protein
MVGKKDTEKESLWREILKRQAGSHVSVRQFCRTEGVSEPSFYAWRKKLGTRENDAAPPATRRKDRSDNGQLFVPLQVLDTAAILEIIHPLGYRIQVTGQVDSVALRRVIQTLDERKAR